MVKSSQTLTIRYVEKDDIYPKFGTCNVLNRIAYVRDDLTGSLRDYVVVHELSHLTDMELIDDFTFKKYWNRIFSELRATMVGGIKHPIGLLRALIGTFFNKDRLKLIYNYYIKGKGTKTNLL